MHDDLHFLYADKETWLGLDDLTFYANLLTKMAKYWNTENLANHIRKVRNPIAHCENDAFTDDKFGEIEQHYNDAVKEISEKL